MKYWNVTIRQTKDTRYGEIYPARGKTRMEAVKDFCETFPRIASNTANKHVAISVNNGGSFGTYRGGMISQ